MSKPKKMDTVFMEYLPSSLPADSGWSKNPPVDNRLVIQKMVKYLVVSILFLGVTLAVFYTLFTWLINQ